MKIPFRKPDATLTVEVSRAENAVEALTKWSQFCLLASQYRLDVLPDKTPDLPNKSITVKGRPRNVEAFGAKFAILKALNRV